MILVADSSALIALSIFEGLPLLELLFPSIVVPRAVYLEVTQKDKPEAHRLKVFLESRVEEIDVREFVFSDTSLELGELEAMGLYKKIRADRLLVDDKRARKIALVNEIKVIGSLGVLLLAKRKGFIHEIKPFLCKLQNSDIFFSEDLFQQILSVANE